MKYPNCFQLISKEFRKAGIPCLIVGGFAVNYHKVTRATLDADFLITDENFGKAHALLARGGYRLVDKQNLVARFTHNEPFFIDVDLIFISQRTMAEMLATSKEVTIRGEKCLVPSLDHLLAMKLHALKQGEERREPKDLLDVFELVEKNRIDVGSDVFRTLCLKYANETVYEKIRHALKPG